MMPKWESPEFRAWWLAYLNIEDGTPEAEEAWAAKCELMDRFERGYSAPRLTVIKDIEPYRAVATDIATGKPPEIMSRAQHREFLKRNNYAEVGNEQPKPRQAPEVNRREIGQQIKHIIDQKGIRL